MHFAANQKYVYLEIEKRDVCELDLMQSVPFTTEAV